jgi:hypothetical protein
MSDIRITTTCTLVSLALLALAWATEPRVRVPDLLADRGETLFPAFRDPNGAASLEVIEFDPGTAAVRPFKVQNRNGLWTIPSHYDYPTDARDQLATTAAALVALKKDDFASDNAADHERTGVLDPLDTSLPTLTGRGTRLIVRGPQEQLLADVIVGKPVEGRAGFRYVRQPGQRRVYISQVGNLKVSTLFGDWIERDLLQIGTDEVDAINLRNYAVDRGARQIDPGETMLLQKSGDGGWTINGGRGGERVNLPALDALLRSLASLTIAGVLPKPAGISATLQRAAGSATLTPDDIADLRRKGFYLTPAGQLLSNRGEIVVRTTSGVFYTLRFGDIAPGMETAAVPAPAADARSAAPRESRYLFIMVDFDAQSAKTPARAAEGAEKVKLLRARFAPWYYVIAADSFAALQPARRTLVAR